MLLGESFHAMTGMGGPGWGSSVLLGSPRFYLGSISVLSRFSSVLLGSPRSPYIAIPLNFSIFQIFHKFVDFVVFWAFVGTWRSANSWHCRREIRFRITESLESSAGVCRSAILHALQGRIALVGILPMFMVTF